MKKLFGLIVMIMLANISLQAQLKFKTGFINGPTVNSVDIVIQPNINFDGYLTNVVFILQIPVGVAQPTITKTSLSPYFVFSTDLATLANEGGYATYGYASGNASVTAPVSITAGNLYPVLRLTFTGGPIDPADIRLSHLIDGGPGSLYQNYVEANAVVGGAADYTSYAQMFFGGVIQPVAPHANENIGYSSYQYTQVSQVLPVKWLSFNAVKSGKDGLISWTVTNEEQNRYYELQRSSDGINFSTIATIDKSASSRGSYNYTDAGITSLGSSIFYYRIMQFESIGKFSYSDIKHINIDKKDAAITIYPNPVREAFYVNIPLDGASNDRVKLNIYDGNGKLVLNKNITVAQARNYYFDISDKKLAAGQYILQVVVDEKAIANKMLTIIQ